MKRLSTLLVMAVVSALLAACASANASTVAINQTIDANIALSTKAADDLATSVMMTQNAPPTATPAPIVPVVVAEYTAAADAQTPDQLCAAAVPAKDPTTRTFTKADEVLQAGIDYRAIFCTAAGSVYVDLTEKETPATVNNFVFLAQNGYYNNTTFHRVLANFMAQGGDPTATGTGGPGYKFNDEILPSLIFDAPGKLAMANSGPNTNGSQFFITVAPQPNLNGGYSLFGLVVKGQANVSKIELRNPDENPTKPGTALNTVLIITDPTKVLVTDNPPPSQADVAKALDGVDALIASESATLENKKLSQSTAEVVSAAPEAARTDLETLFKTYNHQYRVGSILNNKACDVSQISFYSTSYMLDAFATAKDAAAAIADPAMEKIMTGSGFTDKVNSANLTFPYYTAKGTTCGDKQLINAVTYWRRGNFIATVQIAWPADTQTDVLDKVLAQFVGARLYEPLLTTVLYSSIQ